jgi:hypothetical protein
VQFDLPLDQPQMAGDYEYEFDGHGNWTKHSVWVWTRESGERQLLEIDSSNAQLLEVGTWLL